MIKICICKDNVQQQFKVKKILQKIFKDINEEYEIIAFNSGEELLKNYQNDIDIFLLDIQMDKVNGMELARKIREI